MPTAVHVARDFTAGACCHGKCLNTRHRRQLLKEAVCIENIQKVREGTEKKRFIIILEMAEDFNCLLDFWSRRRRQVTGQIVMETSNIQILGTILKLRYALFYGTKIIITSYMYTKSLNECTDLL